MAIRGNSTKRSFYGDQLDFEWYVYSQNGMTSTIKWIATYSCPGCGYIDVTGNMYMELRANGETRELVLFYPSDTRTTYSDGSYIERIFNDYYIGTYWDSAETPLCTKVVKTGTFTVTRDIETNQASFNVSFHGDWDDEDAFTCGGIYDDWIDTYYPGSSYSSMKGYAGTFTPALGTTYGTVTTTTPYGSGGKISSVTWTNDEANPVIKYSYDRGSSVSSATLEACISFTGATDDIPYRQISATGTSYTFPLTDPERNTLWTLLQKGETATVRFYIKTTEIVNGETMIIKNYVSKTVTFVNYKPVPKPTIVDVNPATIAITGGTSPDGYPILVRYMSRAQYNMNIELRKGALDVIGCYIQNGGVIQEGLESGIFENPTSNTFYFSATDDRGYTGTASQSFSSFYGEWIDYVKLTSSVKCTPISGLGELDITVSGKYFGGWFSNNNPNTMSIKYAVYKQGQEPTWVDLGVVSPTVDGSDYTFNIPTVTGLEYTSQYTVDVIVTDRLMTSEVTTTALARPIFFWGKDEFTFNVPVTFDEDIIIGGVSLLELLRSKGWIE